MTDNNKINSITIFDEYRGEDHYILTAEIKENGDLLLEGQDLGPSVIEAFGDSDYEYWYTFKQEWKDTLLLHLLAEKFTVSNPPGEWFNEKGIPFELSTY